MLVNVLQILVIKINQPVIILIEKKQNKFINITLIQIHYLKILEEKTNRVVFKGPVFLDHAGNLAAVGGLNNRNYELMNNLIRGKYYSKTPFIYDSSDNKCFVPGKPKCNSLVSRSLCAPPNKTYQLYEGPFYTQTERAAADKPVCNIEDNYKYDINLLDSQSFRKIANNDLLKEFSYSEKISIFEFSLRIKTYEFILQKLDNKMNPLTTLGIPISNPDSIINENGTTLTFDTYKDYTDCYVNINIRTDNNISFVKFDDFEQPTIPFSNDAVCPVYSNFINYPNKHSTVISYCNINSPWQDTEYYQLSDNIQFNVFKTSTEFKLHIKPLKNLLAHAYGQYFDEFSITQDENGNPIPIIFNLTVFQTRIENLPMEKCDIKTISVTKQLIIYIKETQPVPPLYLSLIKINDLMSIPKPGIQTLSYLLPFVEALAISLKTLPIINNLSTALVFFIKTYFISRIIK